MLFAPEYTAEDIVDQSVGEAIFRSSVGGELVTPVQVKVNPPLEDASTVALDEIKARSRKNLEQVLISPDPERLPPKLMTADDVAEWLKTRHLGRWYNDIVDPEEDSTDFDEAGV